MLHSANRLDAGKQLSKPCMEQQAVPGCHTSDGASDSKRSRQGSLRTPTMEHDPFKLLDLPEACLAAVLCSMGSTDRLALFSTSRSMAAAVLHSCTCEDGTTQATARQHRSGPTLQPAAALQEDSSRRAAVLWLAKSCRNLHLRLQGHTIPLDVDGVTECITQLTLCDISLSNRTISSLPLRQMIRLHTLILERGSPEFRPRTVRADALAQVLQQGGLPRLRTLHVKGMDSWTGVPESGMLLGALAPALGPVITHLATDALSQSEALCGYQQLQRIEIGSRISKSVTRCYCYPLFQLSHLRHIIVPGLCTADDEPVRRAGCVVDFLELRGCIKPEVLAQLPLSEVRHLRLNGWWQRCTPQAATACVQNLDRCSKVELETQTAWKNVCDHSVVGPFADLPFHSPFLDWFVRRVQDFKGALVLKAWQITQLQLRALVQVPLGVHTIICDGWMLGNNCTWQDVMIIMPGHVKRVIIDGIYAVALSAFTGPDSVWSVAQASSHCHILTCIADLT